MSAHAVTLHLPGPVYERFKRRAERQNKTVETELLEAVTTLADDQLPGDLAAELDRLSELEDRALWHVARDRLAEETASHLEELNQALATSTPFKYATNPSSYRILRLRKSRFGSDSAEMLNGIRT